MAIKWNKNGWTAMQDADAQKHVLEINCRAERGVVVELRIRHNDGEETTGTALYKGENALPMDIEDFKKLYLAGELEIK